MHPDMDGIALTGMPDGREGHTSWILTTWPRRGLVPIPRPEGLEAPRLQRGAFTAVVIR
jgi:hypothetical protein